MARYKAERHLSKADAENGKEPIGLVETDNKTRAYKSLGELAENGMYYACLYNHEGELCADTACPVLGEEF